MKTRRRKLRRGGEAISGAEGCVTIPSLVVGNDRKTRNAQYVTKLFYDEKSYKDEKEHNELVLKSVDPIGSFTSAAYDERPIDLSKILPAEREECQRHSLTDIKTLKHLNYKYLGKSIQSIIDMSVPFNGITSQAIIRAIGNLAIKIENMNSKGFFHNDVHGGNIMYNAAVEHAYLIDFGHLGEVPENKLIDLQGLLSTTRSLCVHLQSLSKIPPQLKDFLKAFINDVAPVLDKTLKTPDDESRVLIMKTLTDFSNTYSQFKLTGGNRKTLRRSRR